MKTWLNKLKFPFRRLLALIPTPLPVGLTEFNDWAADIIDLYGLPDNESVRWALAAMLINKEGSKTTPAFYVPKRYFGLAARKASANEVAGYVMRDLKDKQQARQRAEQIAAEEAAKVTVVSDVPSA